ncbi:MAG: acyltransferase [Eubacteriales bacterium]|nr:acyltransferase [Eubacteriales bacterium]
MVNWINNKIQFSIFPSEIGKNLKVNGRIYRRGRGKLILGDNVTINSSKHSNVLGGNDYTTLYTRRDAEIVIGNYVGISNACIVCFNKISIGNHVLIGADCKIYDTDFHSLDAELRGKPDVDIPKCAPIVIEEKAFIGAHSIILKGVHIGKGSIVGAGSVVTKDIPDNEVWAGNPARFIRKL